MITGSKLMRLTLSGLKFVKEKNGQKRFQTNPLKLNESVVNIIKATTLRL